MRPCRSSSLRLARGVDRALISVARSAEEARRLAVEGGLEIALAGEKQEAANDNKPAQPDPEADLLDARIGLHAHRDHDGDEREHDQTRDEDSGLAREEGGHARPAERVGQRREEVDDKDVGVDRRPEEEREPPSGDGEDEAQPAAENPALPRVVAAGARHDAHQHCVGHDQERREHAEHKDCGEQLPVGHCVDERHSVQAERDQVHRPERIDERVERRPGFDQPGRIAEKQRGPRSRRRPHRRVSHRASSLPLHPLTSW